MEQNEYKPSRIALAFFQWYCHPRFREEIEGDLTERYHMHVLKYGRGKANRLFIKEVILLFRPAVAGNIYHLTNTGTMEITNQNKRLFTILAAVVAVLLIPLIAMNFSSEVNWNVFDFLVAGILLLGTGFTLELILRKVKSMRYRILLALALFVVFLLVWAELAVGIFGSPFAGS
ncbi:permease prefix domain 2-containing transporter [Zeaxanthinibacter enoshimensis]|uniref:Uncharacterized protein n=1 Tax=Zeaxanthinibacter enoshimensis TaxID=392009 RepID=A0A4R6TQR6_9FLAO|nr:permease prefix domain 2-containing transporter [Zeaxanthinibacter enoshimensis]TDQ32199.1 hypothetical protein CLV82_0022 [Zeaxanthinibacter enoshimensis]